ncbi:MAG: ribosomal protein S18-alanine N-acetyltransferase [Clostridia bacterium]|nr:ribosomal protein S18-alanine N-acetyltransferase [Clostridia bacterium]
MEQLTISRFSEDDFSALAEIEADAFSTPFKEQDFLSLYESEISSVLTARYGDFIVGHLSYTVILDECQIINVAVREEYRGRGIGSRLLENLLTELKGRGVIKVLLEVRESNLSAIGLYKKHGFSPVGISKNHFSMPRENAILMNLELD